MKALDKKTSADLVKLLIFMVVTTLATAVLVVTIGNISFSSSRDYKAVFADATGVVKGDDVRVAGVKVGSVTDVEIVERTRALVTSPSTTRPSISGATLALIRYRNLVGQRYLSLSEGIGDGRRLPDGATIPLERTQGALDLTAALQRVQAALPGALARRHQQALLRDRPGLPGRGRHARVAARAHRLGHPDPCRPRPGHRRPHRQPQRGARARRRPRRAAGPADHQLPRPRGRPEEGPQRDPLLSRRGLGALGRDRRPGLQHPQAVRPRHRRSCARSPATSTPTRPSSTGPSRCCRSSSRRSAAPRSTARGSTSTSASSRAA